MIEGIVEPSLDAVVSVRVRGPMGEREIEAVLDTGFDGWLSLPAFVVREIGLEWLRSGRAQLADGTEVDVDIHEAEVFWHEGWRLIAADVADTDPLIGMRLLRGSEVCLDVTEGGSIRITPLPR